MASILKNIKREKQIFAYEKVNEVESKKKEYASEIEKLGMMIYTNGLISTMAHLKAKGIKSKVHEKLYYQISEWFQERAQLPYKIDNDLLETLLLEIDDSRMMMLLTKEAIHLSDAFKEMVKVMLKDTENETD